MFCIGLNPIFHSWLHYAGTLGYKGGGSGEIGICDTLNFLSSVPVAVSAFGLQRGSLSKTTAFLTNAVSAPSVAKPKEAHRKRSMTEEPWQVKLWRERKLMPKTVSNKA